MAISAVFHSINSLVNSPFSDCSSGLMSALLALYTICLFMKVSFTPDIILSGWLGSKHRLTNQLASMGLSQYWVTHILAPFHANTRLVQRILPQFTTGPFPSFGIVETLHAGLSDLTGVLFLTFAWLYLLILFLLKKKIITCFLSKRCNKSRWNFFIKNFISKRPIDFILIEGNCFCGWQLVGLDIQNNAVSVSSMPDVASTWQQCWSLDTQENNRFVVVVVF